MRFDLPLTRAVLRAPGETIVIEKIGDWIDVCSYAKPKRKFEIGPNLHDWFDALPEEHLLDDTQTAVMATGGWKIVAVPPSPSAVLRAVRRAKVVSVLVELEGRVLECRPATGGLIP